MISLPCGSKNLWRELPSARIQLADLIRKDSARSNIAVAINEFFETADFATEEIRKVGTNPFFRYTIYPNYLSNGIGAGLGTFNDVSFISPNRLQVDVGIDTASWTSDVLTSNVFEFPAAVVFSWDCDYPGYSAVIEFRTAATEIQLVLEDYQQIVNGATVHLQEYYQWKVTFTPIRSWAFDTLILAQASSKSAWAIDTVNPDNPYQSYAATSLFTGQAVYIENVTIIGEMRLPDRDILDGGMVSLPVSTDFSSLISADHTMRLLNRNDQYSPRHGNFIFAGENDWQRKNLRIEFGFITPSGDETGLITLYVGSILKWGPIPLSIEEDGYESGEVEIYSRDALSLFMDQIIGSPSDDGDPAPVVSGRILREAIKLGDNSLYDPVKNIDYEGTILEELSSVDLSGAGNIIELVTTDPYEGSQCLRSYVQPTGYARGWIDLPVTSDNVLFKTRIKFVLIPDDPHSFNMNFLKIKAGGIDRILLEVDTDHRVYFNYSGTRKETDWYVNRDQDIWQELALGIYGKNPGLIRLSLNGDQILDYNKDGSGDPLDLTPLASIQKVCLGSTVDPYWNQWEIHFDETKLYDSYYPEAYYVPGYPFNEIGSVFVDGVIKVERIKNGITQTYGSGKAVDPIDITKVPDKGMVIFADINNPPSGSVFFMLGKDENTHPVDSIGAILIAGGREALINSASFALFEAGWPNDTVGCFFEKTSIAEAILEISKRALVNVILAQGEVKLLPYDGIAPTSYDFVIDESVCGGLSISDDSENKKNKIIVKWGQYDRNNRLYYEAKDQDSINKLGPIEEELDYSWGGPVGSDNADMAQNRADCLLKRLKGSLTLYEEVKILPWKFLRAEIGDEVQVNIPYMGAPEIFRIVGKEITMTPPYDLKLNLALYPGES